MAWYLIIFLIGAVLSRATEKCSITFSKKTAQVSCTNITFEEYLISVFELKNNITDRVAKISIVVEDSNLPIIDDWISLPWDENYHPLIQSVKIINSSVNVVKPFSKWPALETLDLSRNNITDYRFLSKMKRLKRLFLSYSNFSSDSYLFTYLQREQTRLNLIDLSHCNLDNFGVITNLISNYDLSFNPNLTQIKFNHSVGFRSPFLNLSGNTNIRTLKHLKAVNNNNFCISVDLSYSNISTDSWLLKTIHISEMILLNNNNIPFLDENVLNFSNLISKKCPGRISIDFSNSRLLGISTNFFSFYLLNLLNLSHNNLGNLTGSIFSQADILNLDLSYSNIFSISPSVFNYLVVDTLDLSRNNVSSLDGIFDYIESVVHLDLSFNPIESLDQNAFKNCFDLATLNLSNVFIQSISENAFANILSLKSLTMSFVDTIDSAYIQNMHLNQLTLINTNVSLLKSEQFKGFYNLKKLTFLESSASNINKFALKGLFNLNRINNFKELGNYDITVFEQLWSLEHLDLSKHNLKKLTLELENLRGLKMLNLSSNSISSIDINSFATLKQLQELSLSSNELSSIVVGTFRNLRELTHLYLNKNLLQQLLPGIFSGLDNLVLLDLSQNELLRTKPHLLFGVSVPKLRYLYLQENSIGSEYAQGDNLFRKNEFGIIANHDILKYVDINKNGWRCATLIDILTMFNNKKITVTPTNPEYTSTNINGISCT